MATPQLNQDYASEIEWILGGREFLQTIREVVIAAADVSLKDKRVIRYPRALAENMQMYVDLGLRAQHSQFGLVHDEPANNQLRVVSRHPKFTEPIRLRWCLGRRTAPSVMTLRADKGSETYAGIEQNHQQLKLFDTKDSLVVGQFVWNLWITYNPTLANTEVWVALAHEMPINRHLQCSDIIELASKRRDDDTIVISDRTPSQDPDPLKKAIENSFSERLTG